MKRDHPAEYVLGLGANLGSRHAALRAAVRLLSRDPALRLTVTSSIYESAAVGRPQPAYLNAALRLTTALAPEALLDRLHAVEAELGRVRGERWGPRTLDLDLLWAARPVSSARLTVPHRELERRWFALAPLLEVLPELRPIYGPVLERLGGALAPAGPLAETSNVWLESGALCARAASRAEIIADLLAALGAQLGAATDDATIETRVVQVRGRAVLAQAARAVLDAAASGFIVVEATVCDMDVDALHLILLGGRGLPSHAEVAAVEECPEADGHVAKLVIRRKISDS